MDILRKTEAYFHEKIPITRAMGVTVERYDDEALVLAAPLEANHNHLGTAFGGSLATMATLAGYGLLWLDLGDEDSHVVIKNSSIHYRHPVRGPIRAICRRLPQADLAAFRMKYARTGKAGITLGVTIQDQGRVCVEFEGLFVALR